MGFYEWTYEVQLWDSDSELPVNQGGLHLKAQPPPLNQVKTCE